ncbi:MAG: RidA family protein [Thermodesulfobacteriota bacterium]
MMRKKSFRVFHGGKLMPWATGAAFWDAAGYVWLSGSEGRSADDDQVPPGIYDQAKLAMQKIKERLEEFGTSVENIAHMNYYIVGPEFPNGVANDQKWIDARRALDDFFEENGLPQFKKDNSPNPGTLIGVSSLALKEMLIEIQVVAAIPE